MNSLEDINDPTEAMNAALILFAKAFQLTVPTNNNQRTSSNPRNHQISQPVMNMSQDRQIQNNGGIQVAQNAVQNAGVQSGGNQNRLVVVPEIANQNGTGNVFAPRAEGDLDEIEEVNANCMLMENLQHASTYGTQSITQTTQLRKLNALHLSSAKQITTLNDEISNLNKQLSKEKSSISSLMEEKKKPRHDFKTQEDKFLDKEVDLEAKIKDLENILLKRDQTVQTMHMLNPKPNLFLSPKSKNDLRLPESLISQESSNETTKFV
nr:hypothetical protein [Tanacetum cinerariifolium]